MQGYKGQAHSLGKEKEKKWKEIETGMKDKHRREEEKCWSQRKGETGVSVRA